MLTKILLTKITTIIPCNIDCILLTYIPVESIETKKHSDTFSTYKVSIYEEKYPISCLDLKGHKEGDTINYARAGRRAVASDSVAGRGEEDLFQRSVPAQSGKLTRDLALRPAEETTPLVENQEARAEGLGQAPHQR